MAWLIPTVQDIRRTDKYQDFVQTMDTDDQCVTVCTCDLRYACAVRVVQAQVESCLEVREEIKVAIKLRKIQTLVRRILTGHCLLACLCVHLSARTLCQPHLPVNYLTLIFGAIHGRRNLLLSMKRLLPSASVAEPNMVLSNNKVRGVAGRNRKGHGHIHQHIQGVYQNIFSRRYDF